MPMNDPGLLVGVLFNVLLALVPPAVIAVVALARARHAAAPGLVRTSAVLFLCSGLFNALFQVLWVVVPSSVPDPIAVLSVLGLVQGVLVGLLTTGALLLLVMALWRARTAVRRAPGGYGGGGGYDQGGAVYHAGDPHHGDDSSHRSAHEGAPGAPPAHGQPGDPGAAPSHGHQGSSGSSGGGFWSGWGGGDSGGGWGGGDSGGGGGDGGGGGGGD
ncbi:hypothetical protein SUDANB121_03628 [Nocardiopsis dassonvillei]|uniref:hypothetical protein n=1 Tax=Nocardiopsis dassonvillei TaxID=2014 RepID=UPI003F54DA0F